MHLSQPANHALIGEGVICLQFAVQSYSNNNNNNNDRLTAFDPGQPG